MNEIQDFLASNIVNIFDALDDGVYVTNPEGTTLHVNAMYQKITGLKFEKLMGKNVRDLREEGLFDTVVNPKIVETLKPVTNVQTLQDGKRVVLRGFPVFDENRDLVLVVTLVRDVTLIEQMRDQIFEQKKSLSIYRHQVKRLGEENSRKYNPYTTPNAQKVMEPVIKKAAAEDKSILFTAEEGMGINRIAQMAHDHSSRKNQVFIQVDCSSMQEDQVDEELFGRFPEALDAFTSADSEIQLGVFEAAEKGTVFLKEIEALPQVIQEKLLHLLQEGKTTRAGSPALQQLDTRIMVSTTRNLENEVENGNFNKALYEELIKSSVVIPPLREMPEIIPDIVNHYLKKMEVRSKKTITCPETTLEKLVAHQWPGNFKELKLTLKCVMMGCKGDQIHIENLASGVCTY